MLGTSVRLDAHRTTASVATQGGGAASPTARIAGRIGLLLPLLVLVVLAAGCATAPDHGDALTADAQATHRLYVVRQGWHTGIVVRAAEVPVDAWPARRDFRAAEYLEVGWGDRAFYQAAAPSVWLGLRALLWPTPGALHVVAFNGPVERYFDTAEEIVTLHVTPEGFARLVTAIAASHELDAAGRPIPLGPGQRATSRFYASRDTFHLFRTCNVWTAGVLHGAGVPVNPALSHTAGALLAQLRRHGHTIHRAPRPIIAAGSCPSA